LSLLRQNPSKITSPNPSLAPVAEVGLKRAHTRRAAGRLICGNAANAPASAYHHAENSKKRKRSNRLPTVAKKGVFTLLWVVVVSAQCADF
jgi:hypothetical protein